MNWLSEDVAQDGVALYTVCDVCNEMRCEIIDGVAPRYCEPCKRAGWK